MWKVILADDEAVILNGLHILIDWDELGCDIIGEASDGESLLEKIKTLKPDIVISDIKMPKMTGLDVIAKTKEINDSVKFIFISGFEEFAYAKEAISYGAVDYLLKPVSKKDLTESIKKAIQMHSDQVTADIFKPKKSGVQEIFEEANNGYEYATDELYEKFSELNLDIREKEMVGVTFEILSLPEDVTIEQRELIRFTVYNRIQDAFQNSKEGFVIHKDQKGVNLILIFDKESPKDIRGRVLPIRNIVEQQTGVKLHLGIGFFTDDVKLMRQTYKSAIFACELYYFEENDIIEFEKVHAEYNVTFDDFNEKLREIKNAIFKKEEGVNNYIEEVLDMIFNMHYGNRYAAENRVLIVTGQLMETLYQYNLLEGDYTKRQDMLQDEIRNKKTWSKLKQYILDYYSKLLGEVYKNVKGRESAEIVAVKDYIRENFKKEISLKELSEVACISQSYLSTLFKKETGKNYKDYLVEIRMEEAIRLLLSTEMKTYEIAYEIGYNNSRRFVDTFKNIYNMSPMEYRKANLK